MLIKNTIFTSKNKRKRLRDALFLTAWNSRKIQVKVKDEATVDARGNIKSPDFAICYSYGEVLRFTLSVRVSPLPSYLDRRCEKPQAVGRRRESGPTLSYCVNAGGGASPV